MKKCCKCKQQLQYTEFFKNRSKTDGYASHCKKCCKNNWGIKFICDLCGVEFEIFHRNIRKRKTRKCAKCAGVFGSNKRIELNKKNATYITYSSKGHRYILEAGAKKYRGEHRIVMEKYLQRSLSPTEVIHHIDNNPTNNDLKNLWLTNNSNHKRAHHSLISAAWDAVRRNVIVFDTNTGTYKFNTISV